MKILLPYKPVRHLAIVLAVILMLLPFMTQSAALEDVKQTEKLIKLRPIAKYKETFNAQLFSEKVRYFPGEKIRFRVQGNENFYLYLFNIDPQTGKGIVILPNRLQTNKQIKYQGDNRKRLVPNANVEFYSDRPGVERIVMVASKRYLDVNKLTEQVQTKNPGDFFSLKKSLDALGQVIQESYTEVKATEKRIRMRRYEPHTAAAPVALPKGVLVQEFNLRILAQ